MKRKEVDDNNNKNTKCLRHYNNNNVWQYCLLPSYPLTGNMLSPASHEYFFAFTPLPIELIKLILDYWPIYIYGYKSKKCGFDVLRLNLHNNLPWQKIDQVMFDHEVYGKTGIYKSCNIILEGRYNFIITKLDNESSNIRWLDMFPLSWCSYTSHWTTYPINSHGCALNILDDNTIVLTGGDGKKGSTFCGRYNTINKAWTNLPEMVEKKAFFASVIHKNHLYIFGGARDNKALSSCACLNLKYNKWSKLADINVPRGGAQAVVFDEKSILLIGGSSSPKNESSLSSIELYDIENDTWSITSYQSPSLKDTCYWNICHDTEDMLWMRFSAYMIQYTKQLIIVPYLDARDSWIRSFHPLYPTDWICFKSLIDNSAELQEERERDEFIKAFNEKKVKKLKFNNS